MASSLTDAALTDVALVAWEDSLVRGYEYGSARESVEFKALECIDVG